MKLLKKLWTVYRSTNMAIWRHVEWIVPLLIAVIGGLGFLICKMAETMIRFLARFQPDNSIVGWAGWFLWLEFLLVVLIIYAAMEAGCFLRMLKKEKRGGK